MITRYCVAFIAWVCPGGMLSSLWPAAARPLVCEARPAVEFYDPARRFAARRRVEDLGRPAQLYACRGTRCGPPLVYWSTLPQFTEDK